MKKKFVALLLISMITLSGCGSTEPSTDVSNEAPSSEVSTTTEEDLSELDGIGEIEVDENLLSVELTIPADYVGESTQEDLDAIAEENGFKSITLNADGSATYNLTKAQHTQMMDEMTTSIGSSLAELIGSSETGNITDITHNDDFTEFTATTTSTEITLSHTAAILSFYTYGGMYNIFNGTPVDNVHVDFVNADSGEIIGSSDSADAGSTEQPTE